MSLSNLWPLLFVKVDFDKRLVLAVSLSKCTVRQPVVLMRPRKPLSIQICGVAVNVKFPCLGEMAEYLLAELRKGTNEKRPVLQSRFGV